MSAETRMRAGWIALAVEARVGGVTLTRLLERFGSVAGVFAAAQSDLTAVRGVGPLTAQAIGDIDLTAFEGELAQWGAEGIATLTWLDASFPTALLHCTDAPPVLFVRGDLRPDDARAVAIVGTREPGEESLELAHRLGRTFALHDWTVVSGLALGIDAAAHRGALAGHGRTLAVLACGLTRVYPAAHRALAHEVVTHGALLSESHPASSVSRQSLVARNRITTGLSRAVIVVETGEQGGSMSAARRAFEQGRTVYAVAGSSGCDALIESGARVLEPGFDLDVLLAEIDAFPAAEVGQSSLMASQHHTEDR